MSDGPDYRQQEEAEMREFIEERERERANELVAEMNAGRDDDEFVHALQIKFPQLLAWPGKDQK